LVFIALIIKNIINATKNKLSKTKNIILDILAIAAVIPVKPSIPATINKARLTIITAIAVVGI